MSSAWWLGWNCMLGLGAKSQTAQNLLREGECVLNLPSTAQVEAVNRLARLTGANPVPSHKQAMGYRYEKDKFGRAGLTASRSALVRPPRIEECPVQLEALQTWHPFGHRPDKHPTALAFELRIIRTHVDDTLLVPEKQNHIDPDRWRPLLMSFCQFYGLGERLSPSKLADIPEEMYRPVPHMTR